MKAILEFDLSNPDDGEDYKWMRLGPPLRRAMWDFAQDTLRRYRKHGCEELVKEVENKPTGEILEWMADKIETEFYEALRDNGVELE